MITMWITAMIVFANLAKAEQAPNETASRCPQSEYCTTLGGECFRNMDAPEGATKIRVDGKKVRCNDKRPKCWCYNVTEVETPSLPVPDDCSLPDIEHVGNDLDVSPLEATSSEECQQICEDHPDCKHFTFFAVKDGGCVAKNVTGNDTLNVTGNCYLKTQKNDTYNNCSVSGPSTCLPGEGNPQARIIYWQNPWDGTLYAMCPAGYTISLIISEHSNYHEDRRWRFDCKYSTFDICQWSGWVNTWDAPLVYVCPGAGVIRGVYSYHSNYHEDRVWQYYCCRRSNLCWSDCHFTGLINYWDAWMDYTVPNGWYVAGIQSVHDNHREDREWRVMICQMKAC